MTNKLDLYLEVGSKRTFAAALFWPGFCRMGHDEASALRALLEYGPRYAAVLRQSKLGFHAPTDRSDFVVVERLKGNATTDFGAPDLIPRGDAEPLSDEELHRQQSILKACWRAFEAGVQRAKGKHLRSGPRGGGRSLNGIFEHVAGAEESYLSKLGGKAEKAESLQATLQLTHQAILKTLTASAHGEVPSFGPRGGKRWPPRYFVRRAAWHVLDHLWEIEDRVK